MSFLVDIWAGSQLTTTSINPVRPGSTKVNLSFELEDSNENLVEIRVMNERSAIYGRLALGQVTVTLLQNISPKVIEILTTELGLPRDGSPGIPETA
jgi:hypothetical protein